LGSGTFGVIVILTEFGAARVAEGREINVSSWGTAALAGARCSFLCDHDQIGNPFAAMGCVDAETPEFFLDLSDDYSMGSEGIQPLAKLGDDSLPALADGKV
jgi:hypothetical protein